MALEGNAGLGAKYMGDMDEGTRRWDDEEESKPIENFRILMWNDYKVSHP